MALFEALNTLYGQVAVGLAFALFWGVFIETINEPVRQLVKRQKWWPQALPNQIAMMVNFGFEKDKISERVALESFTWVITMCITHICSATLMIPVILRGWEGAGSWGQLFFALGTLSEVGFDLYDGPKLFLLAFFADHFPKLGGAVPVATFVLVGGLHHSTVLSLTIPMNLKYIYLPAYHWIAFSLLFSAGVCYIAGHYKFTVDAKSAEGLKTCKLIVLLQFVMNYLSRLFIFFPAAYLALRTFSANGDSAYLYGGGIGMLGLGLYNLAVLADATKTMIKWTGKDVKEA